MILEIKVDIRPVDVEKLTKDFIDGNQHLYAENPDHSIFKRFLGKKFIMHISFTDIVGESRASFRYFDEYPTLAEIKYGVREGLEWIPTTAQIIDRISDIIKESPYNTCEKDNVVNLNVKMTNIGKIEVEKKDD